MFLFDGSRFYPATCIVKFPYIFSSGSAAAADDPCAFLREFLYDRGKFVRSHVIDGLSVHPPGQPGVGLDHYRQTGEPEHLLYVGPQLCRTQTAVDADHVCAKSFKKGYYSFYVGSRHELAPFVEGYRAKNRQPGIFLYCKHCALEFQGIRHGLDDRQISPCLFACYGHGPERIVALIKVQVTQRFEQPAGRAEIQGNKTFPLITANFAHCIAGYAYAGFYDIRRLIARAFELEV